MLGYAQFYVPDEIRCRDCNRLRTLSLDRNRKICEMSGNDRSILDYPCMWFVEKFKDNNELKEE